MGVMAAPRKRAPKWEEIPPEPVPIESLRDVRDQIEVGRRRVEIIDGVVVVSPMPAIWHERACQWLLFSFLEACKANDWWGDTGAEIELPPTGDLIEPDFMILCDASTLPDSESLRPLDRVLLAAEIVSPSSIQRDRIVKPRACALAGIPLYLLVDRYTRPLTISLHSDPGQDGYGKVTTAIAGEKLQLPAPFDLTLDTSSLPLPS